MLNCYCQVGELITLKVCTFGNFSGVEFYSAELNINNRGRTKRLECKYLNICTKKNIKNDEHEHCKSLKMGKIAKLGNKSRYEEIQK